MKVRYIMFGLLAFVLMTAILPSALADAPIEGRAGRAEVRFLEGDDGSSSNGTRYGAGLSDEGENRLSPKNVSRHHYCPDRRNNNHGGLFAEVVQRRL